MTNNYANKQSSCYFLDIRNSTSIIRTISLKTEKVSSTRSGNTADRKKIIAHAGFMLAIHKFLFDKLRELKINEYYFNNTGDGHVCLVWNRTHAWTILNIACSISIYLEKKIEEYHDTHLKLWTREYQKDLSIGFGIGMHTGESIIAEEKTTKSKFAYGIVLNTAARTESFTKNFPGVNLLFTEHFKSLLERQYKLLGFPGKDSWAEYEKIIEPLSQFSVDIKDGKSNGHLLYTISKSNRSSFIAI